MSETDSSKKTRIDLSDWEIDEWLDFDAVKDGVRETAVTLAENILQYLMDESTNEDLVSLDFKLIWERNPKEEWLQKEWKDKLCDPLTLSIYFPAFDDMDPPRVDINLRKFLFDREMDDKVINGRYGEIAEELRKFADEIDAKRQSVNVENP